METRANYLLIGIFTLAVIAAAFGFVFWFQNLGAVAQRTPIRIIFEGSASGLRTGGAACSARQQQQSAPHARTTRLAPNSRPGQSPAASKPSRASASIGLATR